MKQKINIYHFIIIATASLILPILYIYHAANTIIPFHLNGKQFLHFFGLLTVTAFITDLIWQAILKRQEAVNNATPTVPHLLQPAYCIVLTFITGIARLIQGISNQKPVGYLLLLLLLNFFLLLLLTSRSKKM